MQPVSIVIPTLNEAGSLPMLFERIHVALSSATIPYEILVIDDHSTDDTQRIATEAHPKYSVRLLKKQGEAGKAFSLLEGFAAAKHELVCMIDGDLQYPPEAIKLMYHKLQYLEADVVLTRRVDHQTGPMRRLTSYVFNLVFTRWLFGINYDTQSGLKLFRKDLLKTISVEPSAWTFDLEFIIKALEQNYVIAVQDITFSERYAGVPKVKILSATKEIAAGSFRLWRNSSIKTVKSSYKTSERLQRGFNALGAILIATVLTTGATTQGASALSVKDVVTSPVTAVQEVFSDNKEVKPPKPSTSNPANPTSANAPSGQNTSNSTQSAPQLQGSTQPSSRVAATTDNKTISQPVDRNNLQSNTGKNDSYYPGSKLSSDRTNSLLKIAGIAVLTGASLIGLAWFIIASRALVTRIRRQTA